MDTERNRDQEKNTEYWEEFLKEHQKTHVNIKETIDVPHVVKKHLEESILFTNEEYRPKGGLYITPKPKTARLDVVTIGVLAATHFKEYNEASGIININVQHEDQDRIDLLSSVIIDVMDEAFIDGYLFNTQMNPILFRLSRTLLSRNIRTNFEKGNYNIGE